VALFTIAFFGAIFVFGQCESLTGGKSRLMAALSTWCDKTFHGFPIPETQKQLEKKTTLRTSTRGKQGSSIWGGGEAPRGAARRAGGRRGGGSYRQKREPPLPSFHFLMSV
jgi:hypothetical protein